MNSVAQRKTETTVDGANVLHIVFTNGDRRTFACRPKSATWYEWSEAQRAEISLMPHTQRWCAKQYLAATVGR